MRKQKNAAPDRPTTRKLLAQWQDLVSDEHFSVDVTLIQAWASHKSRTQ